MPPNSQSRVAKLIDCVGAQDLISLKQNQICNFCGNAITNISCQCIAASGMCRIVAAERPSTIKFRTDNLES